MAAGTFADIPVLVPLTPAQVRARFADARVRRRVRAILTHAGVDPHRYERAVAIAAAAADDASLFLDGGDLADRIEAEMGHPIGGWKRGFIVGLALALAAEDA